MRVLIADDSRSYRIILRQILETQGFEVTEVTDGEAAYQMLVQDDPPALAILDWTMPGMTGPDVCRGVRGRGEDIPFTYLFLLTGRDRVEDLTEGLASGADDYLTKPFVRQELEARIMVGQRNALLHATLAKMRRDLWEQSTKDELTRIWNRRGIQERLESMVSEDQQEPLSLVMMDVDFFKRINDEYGHPVGDVVLKVVVRRLQHALRGSDEVGRFGGEEFLVALPGAAHEEALAVAERIRRIISSEPVHTVGGSVEVTASFGVATVEVGEIISTSRFISDADAALYRAKENGRNRVESGQQRKNVHYLPDVALVR